jgi:hypothetical protein
MTRICPRTARPRAGLLPLNKDGFEDGDRENFAPVYIGDSSEWVRPQMEVSSEDSIAGQYSLVMRGDGTEQRWLLASNAFRLEQPMVVSVLFRQLHAEAEFALLGAIERYSKGETPRFAIVDALRICGADVRLALGVDAANWPAQDHCVTGVIEPYTVYRLIMEYDADNTVRARVLEEQSSRVVARLVGVSRTAQNGVGLYFHAASGSRGMVQADDFGVEYDSYELKEDTWARGPQFVVFKRQPDAVEDQGEWVGGASMMFDAEDQLYKLWYRIRRGGVRGKGYGYATSRDGLSWERYAGNPVITYDKQRYSSTEKLTVVKHDGLYHGWYTADVNTEWHILYTTSPDGVEWTLHGEVLTGGYFKDPDVVRVDGTYYMYLISPTSERLSVMTSTDGRDWEFGAAIPAPCHVHIGAYYDAAHREFVLFQDAVDAVPYMRAARSVDGLHFGEFQPVLHNAEVGLDDIGIGVNYPTFYRDALGHITQDDHELLLYQARHDYHNNRPGWAYAGDGKLVMAGRFRGVRLGVPSVYRPLDGLYYRSFPIHSAVARGFELKADATVEFCVESWTPGNNTAASWWTRGTRARVSYAFSGLRPGSTYRLTCGADAPGHEVTADESGDAAATALADGAQTWELTCR